MPTGAGVGTSGQQGHKHKGRRGQSSSSRGAETAAKLQKHNSLPISGCSSFSSSNEDYRVSGQVRRFPELHAQLLKVFLLAKVETRGWGGGGLTQRWVIHAGNPQCSRCPYTACTVKDPLRRTTPTPRLFLSCLLSLFLALIHRTRRSSN